MIMFDELLNLVKEHAGSAIINNPAVPNEKNDAVCETATNSIIDKMKEMAGSGGIDSITSMFQSGSNVADHPAASNISSGVVNDLMKKFGFDGATASGIVAQLIPTVLSKLTSKTNDPNDKSFDLNSIIGSLTGGSGNSILNTIKGFFGSK
jgi:uncharacterized protein YidB (DUF937 family)